MITGICDKPLGDTGSRSGPAVGQTVFRGDIAGFLFDPAELDGANHVIGAIQRFAPVGSLASILLLNPLLLHQFFGKSGD